MIDVEQLRRQFRGDIALHESLAPFTTYKIGGPADLFLEPLDARDVEFAVGYLREREIPFIVLGNGSNVLVADGGYRGAVLNLEKGFGSVEMDNGEVVAGAGIRLATLVDFCIQHGLQGAEMLAGIPGTLGGAVIMNAGAYGGEISDFMVSVDVLRDGHVRTLAKAECGFAYRTSDLHSDIALSARFRMPTGDKENMKLIRRETMLKRNSSQPVQYPNAGSIFKNPPGQFAAVLIQDCGLKGLRVGGAEVSPLHANFLVGVDRASAQDIVELIRTVQDTVAERTGIHLELEVKLIGFDAATVSSLQWN